MTERFKINVPLNGVRRDVADLVQGPDMMAEGTNVMVYDGTVMPRPGLTREGFVSGTTTNWVELAVNVVSFSTVGSYIIYQDNDSSWFISADSGVNWSALTVNGLTGESRQLFELKNAGVVVPMLYVFDTDGKIYHFDTTAYAGGAITFVYLGSYRYEETTTTEVRMHHDPLVYDEVNDIVYWQNKQAGGLLAKYFYALENASTVVAATFVANLTVRDYDWTYHGWGQNIIGVAKDSTDPGLIVQEWYFWGDPQDMWFTVRKYSLSDFTTSVNGSWLWSFPEESQGPVGNMVHWIEELDTGGKEFLYLRGYGLRLMTRHYPPIAGDSNVLYGPSYLSGQFGQIAWSDSADDAVMVGRMNVRTEDGWDTGDVFEDTPFDSPNWIAKVWGHLSGGDNFYYLSLPLYGDAVTFILYRVQGADPSGSGLGILPSGDSELGSSLSLFQGDYGSYDESALIQGAEKILAYLDRANSEWIDVAPTALTPLGATPAARWVFRGAEKGGDKYILATNGVITPLAASTNYTNHDDKADGTIFPCFRPLGDTDEDGTAENVIPPAKCMAFANNRLVLGNIVGDTPLSVRLSAPQDFDSGYEDEYKLADTFGDIVSMRELNAITIAILKTDAIYHGISQVEFMGVSAPMRFELIKTGISGPCCDASVVYLPDGRLCWLGRDGGVYIYDGTVPRDAGRHIRHMVSPILDVERYEWAWGMVDPRRNLLWFFFPTRTQPYGMNTGICMSIDQSETWPAWFVQYPSDWEAMAGASVFTETDLTYGDFPTETYGDLADDTYGSYSGAKWQMLLLRRNNSLYQQQWLDGENKYTDGGFPIGINVETGWYDFDDAYTFDTFHEMHHTMDLAEGENLQWTVIGEQADGSHTEQEDTLTHDDYRHRTTYRVTGRRHKFRCVGQITRRFRWGGADGMFSRRGGR